MTDRKELENLIATARHHGAAIRLRWDAAGAIKSVQVDSGIPGCGPHPMSAISAAERLRSFLFALAADEITREFDRLYSPR